MSLQRARGRAGLVAVLALGAAAVALAVAWLARPTPDAMRAAGPAQAAERPPADDEATPSSFAAPDGAIAVEPGERTQVAHAAPSHFRFTPIDPGPGIRVVGTVRAPAFLDDVRVAVSVVEPPDAVRSAPQVPAVRPDSDGRYEIDVTRLFVGVSVAPTALRVETLQSKVPNASVTIPVAIGPVIIDGRRVTHAPDIEIRADLEIDDYGVARGSVVCEREPPGPIYVIAIEVDESGAPVATGLHAIVRSSGGPFEIELDPARPYWLVACAYGLRPASVEVGVVGVGSRDVGELSLSRGEVLSGRVARLGELERISARFAGTSRAEIGTVGGQLQRTELGFEFTRVSAPVDERGAFEIAGLAEAPYDVAPATSSASHAFDDVSTRVAAPAAGLVIAPGNAAVRVELRRDGKPLSKMRVDWSAAAHGGGMRSGAGSTDAEGRVTFWLKPGATVELRVEGRDITLAAGAESDLAWRVFDL